MKLSVMFSTSITATTAAHIQLPALGERSRSRAGFRTASTTMTAKGTSPSSPSPSSTSRAPLWALPRSSSSWLSRNSGDDHTAAKPCPCNGRSRNCSHDTRQMVRRWARVGVSHSTATVAAAAARPAPRAVQAAARARRSSVWRASQCRSTGSAVNPAPAARASHAVRLPAPIMARIEPTPRAAPASLGRRSGMHSIRMPAMTPTAATGASRLRLM